MPLLDVLAHVEGQRRKVSCLKPTLTMSFLNAETSGIVPIKPLVVALQTSGPVDLVQTQQMICLFSESDTEMYVGQRVEFAS